VEKGHAKTTKEVLVEARYSIITCNPNSLHGVGKIVSNISDSSDGYVLILV